MSGGITCSCCFSTLGSTVDFGRCVHLVYYRWNFSYTHPDYNGVRALLQEQINASLVVDVIANGKHEIASNTCPLTWHMVVAHRWKCFASVFPAANAPLCSRTERGQFLSNFIYHTDHVSRTELKQMKQANNFRVQPKLPEPLLHQELSFFPCRKIFYTFHPWQHKPFLPELWRYKHLWWQLPLSKKGEQSSCFYLRARLQSINSPLLQWYIFYSKRYVAKDSF